MENAAAPRALIALKQGFDTMDSPFLDRDEPWWSDRLSRAVARLRRLSMNRMLRLVSLLIVLPLFGIALYVAWRRADLGLEELAIRPVVIVVAAVPLTVLAATWQLRAITLSAGGEVGWHKALRVVTLGALSGLLPVASGTVVRAGAIVYWGVRPGAAAWSLAFDAVAWFSVCLLYSGCAAFLAGAGRLSALMTVGGLLLIPLAFFLGRHLAGGRGRLEITAARLGGALVDVVRLQACFFALGYSVTFVEASTLAAASPLASLFFFLPGGIGVREAFISAVGAAVGLSAAGAFLAAAVNRLLGLSVLLAWELGLQAWGGVARQRDTECASRKTSF